MAQPHGKRACETYVSKNPRPSSIPKIPHSKHAMFSVCLTVHTRIEIIVHTNVASGVTEGSMLWWDSCTSPPVIEACCTTSGERWPNFTPSKRQHTDYQTLLHMSSDGN